MDPVLMLAVLFRVSGVLSASVVKDVKVGDSVTLPCKLPVLKDRPVEQLDVQWRLGEQLVIRLYRGQVSYGINYRNRTELPAEGSSRGDFSLIITHTQHGDSGVYQCVISRENQDEPLGEVELRVKAPPSPSAVFGKVSEEVVLPCFGRVDWFKSEAELVRWFRGDRIVLQWEKGSLYVDPQFTDRASLLKDGILKDDLSLVLKNTIHEDRGLYICYFVNNQGIRVGSQVNLTVADHLTRVEAGFGSSVLLPLHTASAVSVRFLPDGGKDTVRRMCEVKEDQLKCEAAYTHRTVLHTFHTKHNNPLKLENLSMGDSGTFSVIERESRRTVSVLFLQVFTTPAPPPAGISGESEIITVRKLVMLSLIVLGLVIFLAKQVNKCNQQRHSLSVTV
ncbi:butyrophilin subfamily 1 member A1-like isoform X1 [Astyanax mexicanus]|uniref:Butyrophilin subfamily 1 member A1-like isoform X1 n=1 Tax=Astyanax mexicanus TaxID=7994 RepID=A0A8T2L8F6_ASTMX|nr:butyrophilin subfamily 1 member A1-like isoform X1 [Astyanax mexicanus]